MKAAVLHAPKTPLVIEEVAIAKPGPRELNESDDHGCHVGPAPDAAGQFAKGRREVSQVHGLPRAVRSFPRV